MAPLRFLSSLMLFAACLVFAVLSAAEIALFDGWDGLVHFIKSHGS